MVDNNGICISSNVFIHEFSEKEGMKRIREVHNVVTQNGLIFTVQRIVNKYITNNMTNYYLSLLGIGNSGADACTIPSVATITDTGLVNQVSLNTSSTTYGSLIRTINNKQYLDITNNISFTSLTSWKVSLTLTSDLLPSTSNNQGMKYINEFGLFTHNLVDITAPPSLFARVTMAPFTLEENRVYVLDWYFSLSYQIT
jgi:hypothetical protein